MNQKLSVFGNEFAKVFAFFVATMGGMYFAMTLMAFIFTLDIPMPPSPFKLGACLANKYHIMCHNTWGKTDSEIIIEPKIQDRIIPE